MNSPPYFEVMDQYAAYRPVGEVSFREAVRLAAEAIAYSRENAIRRLLVNTVRWTGFDPPRTTERFHLGEALAYAAQSKVILAVVARPDMIDPDRFGMTVARNRGLLCDVFVSEPEAVAWLTSHGAA